ncbi:hypothetical protein D9M73_282350 [compost metagenome]
MPAQGDALLAGGIGRLALLRIGHQRIETLQRRILGEGGGSETGQQEQEFAHSGFPWPASGPLCG